MVKGIERKAHTNGTSRPDLRVLFSAGGMAGEPELVRRPSAGEQLTKAIVDFKTGGLELDAEPVRRRVISLTDRLVPGLTANIAGLTKTVTRGEVRRGGKLIPLGPDELERRQLELEDLRARSADARMLRRVARRIDKGLPENRVK